MPAPLAQVNQPVEPAPPPPPQPAFVFPLLPTLTLLGGVGVTIAWRIFQNLLLGKYHQMQQQIRDNAQRISAVEGRLSDISTEVRVGNAEIKARLDALHQSTQQLHQYFFELTTEE